MYELKRNLNGNLKRSSFRIDSNDQACNFKRRESRGFRLITRTVVNLLNRKLLVAKGKKRKETGKKEKLVERWIEEKDERLVEDRDRGSGVGSRDKS